MKPSNSLLLLLVGTLFAGTACAKKSKNREPAPQVNAPAPQSPAPPAPGPVESPGIKLSVTSDLAKILAGGEPLAKLRDRAVSEDEAGRFSVRFEFPRKLAENARLSRTIGKRTSEVQLLNVHETEKGLLTGTDIIALGNTRSLLPVPVIYRWENGDDARELRVSLKRSWLASGTVDLRDSKITGTDLQTGELDLEYLILDHSAKLVIGSKPLRVRARIFAAEPGSSIVSFSEQNPRAASEPANSGSVLLQASELSGQLIADLHGADGNSGAPGADRAPSERGANGVQGLATKEPCTILKASTPGEKGPQGFPGQTGENGGDGGSLTIRTAQQSSNLAIQFSGAGGKGGAGGAGGRGGPGGAGVQRVALGSMPFCEIPATIDGPSGDPGPNGEKGRDGKSNGSLQKLAPLPDGTPLN